ncbi:MAG: hypothetical protein ABIA75_02645 [Candidatus Neomarinimicrobiota bacterium]
MSFIITTYVREGIVMASDSRMTLNATNQQGTNTVQMAVGQSDTNYKTFLTNTHIGISIYGDAAINNVPIAGFIESFIFEHLQQGNYDIEQIPAELLSYFSTYSHMPNTRFHIAGYKKNGNVYEQQIWEVNLANNSSSQLNQANQQGVTWGGEGDIISRIILPVFQKDSNGNYQPVPHHSIPYQFFTLQDAIDFSVYAIRTTIDTLRFQPRPKTVGGPIDVLVLKPADSFWVSRKELTI